MVPPYSEATTATIVHAMSSYRSIEAIVGLVALSVVMFIFGFAVSQTLSERPRVRVVRGGQVIAWPSSDAETEAPRQAKS